MHACTCLTYADVPSILHREIETKRGREDGDEEGGRRARVERERERKGDGGRE